jgi:hypothetical protein
MQVKFISFGSSKYSVVVDRVSGTYYILEKETDKSTKRYVNRSGYDFYCYLKREFKKSRKQFNNICQVELLGTL